MDWLPIVSQVKSLVQVISGDSEGAKRTQENFSQQCPIVSQTRSAVEAIAGNPEAARRTQIKQLEMIQGVADGIPVVGHIKGAVHYAVGDNRGGDQSMKAASRTVGVIGGGIGGMVVGGPAGAIAGGVAGGLAMDGITTGVDSGIKGKYSPSGQIEAVTDIVQKTEKNENVSGNVFDSVGGLMFDGLAGYQAGKAFRKIKSDHNAKKLVKYLDGEGNMSLDESFIAAEKIESSGKYLPIEETSQPKPNDILYEENTVPDGGWAEEGRRVYRGDKRYFEQGFREQIFQEGIAPDGNFNDAGYHARGEKGCNFTSTSSRFQIAKEFGEFGTKRKGFRSAVLQADVVHGVDIRVTAQLLDRISRFPGQYEVSMFNGIQPGQIVGILIQETPGGVFNWHANPNYVKPVQAVPKVNFTPHGNYLVIPFDHNTLKRKMILEPITFVTFKTCHSTYFRAHPGGEGATIDLQTAIGPWEKFTIVNQGDNVVALKSCHGTYVRAHPGGEGATIDLQTAIGPWEKFTIVNQGDNVVALKSCHGTYVRAHPGGEGATIDLQTAIGPWEKFTME